MFFVVRLTAGAQVKKSVCFRESYFKGDMRQRKKPLSYHSRYISLNLLSFSPSKPYSFSMKFS